MVKGITVHELQDRLATAGGAFVLDVRGADAFQAWRLDDRGVVSANVPTSKLRDAGPESFSVIPRNREIVTVCAKGIAAQEAGEILLEHGYSAVYLVGGMSAWSEYYRAVPVHQASDYELWQIMRPAKGCLSYFIVSGGEALVVDPGRNTQFYQDMAERTRSVIRCVLDTHLHADHISSGRVLAQANRAQYVLAESGEFGPFQRDHAAAAKLASAVDARVMNLGNGNQPLDILAFPTPGHTPGSCSLLVSQRYLITGDTLFVNGLGRPDLGGMAEAGAKMMYDTATNLIRKLHGDLVVLPAHYSDSSELSTSGFVGGTLDAIRSKNEFLQGMDESTFVASFAQKAGETPPNFQTIRQINQGDVRVSDSEAATLEIGPNRCAVK